MPELQNKRLYFYDVKNNVKDKATNRQLKKQLYIRKYYDSYIIFYYKIVIVKHF